MRLTLAWPAHHNIIVEGLGQVALDLKVVDLDFHILTNVAITRAGRAGCLGQCLQAHHTPQKAKINK